MAVLAVLVVLGVAGLVMQLVDVAAPPFLGAEQVTEIVDDVLAVFVLLELLATALAYVRSADVLRRLFEAAFIAIVRKLITLHLEAAPLEKASAVGVLFVATALAWWLVVRARPAR